MPTPTSYVIPVSNGLLEHRERIGNAIWTFLWFIDRITAEPESKASQNTCDGLVLGGAPIPARRIAADLRENPRTTQVHIDHLCEHGYVRRITHGPGEAFGEPSLLSGLAWANAYLPLDQCLVIFGLSLAAYGVLYAVDAIDWLLRKLHILGS